MLIEELRYSPLDMPESYVYFQHRRDARAPMGWRRSLRMCVVALLAASTLVGTTSCSMWDTGWNWDGSSGDEVPESAFGRRGIYIPTDAAEAIGSTPPRAQTNGTGIAQVGTRLYVVELGIGVHVYNNSDPRNPVGISFITIPGVTTIEVRGDRLYADNFTDLVTIDVSDPNNARLVDRDAGLFDAPLDFPVGHQGFFECFDPSRGLLVGWEDALLTSPRCRM